MKSLKLNVGDVLIIKRRTDEKELGQCIFVDEEYDVITVTNKTIVLQKYPTYERKRVKFK